MHLEVGKSDTYIHYMNGAQHEKKKWRLYADVTSKK